MSIGVRIAAVALSATAFGSTAMAQDYGPFGYGATGSGYGFDWNGFYAGVYGGGVPMGNTPSFNGGIFTGVNVSIESAIVGLEAQLGGDIADDLSLDALLMAKGGMALGPVLVYGTGGGGLVGGDVGYAFGGGADYGITDYMSVRGEVLGTGAWGDMPSDLRLTAGLSFHL